MSNFSSPSFRLACGVALAGLAFGAHAQFRVEYAGNAMQIGGRVNVSYDHTKVTGFTPGAANDPNLAGSVDRVFGGNASRLNFTFTRAFGPGYMAEIFLDSSVVPTAGSGTLAGRENWLGVFTPYGRFRAGRVDTPVKAMGEYTDVYYATGIADDGEMQMMGGEDKLIGFTRRQQKSLRYDTLRVSGWAFAAHLALPNADGSAVADAPPNAGRKGQVYSTAVTYANGPLSGGFGYEVHRNLRYTGTSTGLTDKGWRLGAKYVFDGLGDIGAGANTFTYEAPVGSHVTRPYLTVTGNLYLGMDKVTLRVGKAGNAGGSAPNGTVVCGTPNASATFTSCSGTLALVKGPNSGARQIVLGYDHAFDKQTSLYGYYTQIHNDSNANYNFGTNGYGPLKAGNSVQGVSAGVIYIF
jgi:predicted porin